MQDIPGYENEYAVTRNGSVWSYPKGQRSKVLTNEKALEIRTKHDGKYGTGVRLAREYNISSSVISGIYNNKIYKNL